MTSAEEMRRANKLRDDAAFEYSIRMYTGDKTIKEWVKVTASKLIRRNFRAGWDACAKNLRKEIS